MTSSTFRQILLGTLLLCSCAGNGEKEQKASSNSPVATVDTNTTSTKSKITTDTLNIRSFMPEYTGDSSFHEISCLQVRTGVQEIYYYCIYKMTKQNVVKAFNKRPKTASLIKENGQTEYAKLKKIDNKYFFEHLYESDENNSIAQDFFYKFKKLKDYEIYAYFTPMVMHQIIFDKNSDTVYHRVRNVIY